MSGYSIKNQTTDSALPLVSFLIPVYKTPPKWLWEMFYSVLRVARKYGNYEIIIHDDHSNEPELTKLLETLAAMDSERIRLSTLNSNVGICVSRQILLELAKGKYIVSFDSDDLMLDFDLAEEIRYLEANPQLAATYARKYSFDSNYKITNDCMGMPYSPFISVSCMCPMPNGAIIRREALASCGGYANIDNSLADDFVMFSRLSEHYNMEMRPVVRAMNRIHDNHYHDSPSGDASNQYCRQRILMRNVECSVLLNEKIELKIPDYQVLALAGLVFRNRQNEFVFCRDFLARLLKRYSYDMGMQSAYMSMLFNLREFDKLQGHIKTLSTMDNIPEVQWVWFSQVAQAMVNSGLRNEWLFSTVTRSYASLDTKPDVAVRFKQLLDHLLIFQPVPHNG